MKKLILLTLLIVSLFTTTNATSIFVCDGAHARIYNFDANGNFLNFSEQGGCAGIWGFVMSSVPHYDGNHDWASNINSNFVIGEGTPPYISQVWTKYKNEEFDTYSFDPEDFSSEVIEFLGW